MYNGTVGTVDGASGKLYVQNFFSRKAPLDENGMISHLSYIGANFVNTALTDLFLLIAITKGNLVHYTGVPQKGLPFPIWLVLFVLVMRVPTHGSRDPNYYRALNLNDRVYWGEVCPHGNQLYEDKQRQQGNICVNLASPAIFQPDNAPDVEHEFSEGDAVVIIDCQSFVPEYMPVIRAYEQQKNEILPFNDGLLLNLDASRPADLTNTVLGADAQNKAATEGVFQRSIFDKFGCGSLTNTVTTLRRHLIENLVDDMVVSSTILPLREIRQNATISQQMQAELVDLLLKATFGQLVNFIDSLRNPVNCTQGPPGTGKSYLGVQIVYLTIIRKYWSIPKNTKT